MNHILLFFVGIFLELKNNYNEGWSWWLITSSPIDIPIDVNIIEGITTIQLPKYQRIKKY